VVGPAGHESPGRLATEVVRLQKTKARWNLSGSHQSFYKSENFGGSSLVKNSKKKKGEKKK